MVVSLNYDLVGSQQLLTDLVWLIYLKLVGNPCSLKYFTYSKCRWYLLNLRLANRKIFNSIDNSKIFSWIMLQNFFLWKKWSSILSLIPDMILDLTLVHQGTQKPLTLTLGGLGLGVGQGFRGGEKFNQQCSCILQVNKENTFKWISEAVWSLILDPFLIPGYYYNY